MEWACSPSSPTSRFSWLPSTVSDGFTVFYWVVQKVHLSFPIRCYGNTNPVFNQFSTAGCSVLRFSHFHATPQWTSSWVSLCGSVIILDFSGYVHILLRLSSVWGQSHRRDIFWTPGKHTDVQCLLHQRESIEVGGGSWEGSCSSISGQWGAPRVQCQAVGTCLRVCSLILVTPRFGQLTNSNVGRSLLIFNTKGQFSSAPQSRPTLCNPMDCSTPGFPVHHQLPKSQAQ